MTRHFSRLLATGFLALGAVPAAAQGAWNFEEARIGRIYIEEMDETCHASQVGADLVVTSAHCVMAVGAESPVDPGAISFTPDRILPGEAGAVSVTDIAVDPAFRREDVPSREQVGRDVAYLRLGEPIGHPGDAMGMADPSQGYLATLEIAEDGSYSGLPCPAAVEEDGVVILDCARDAGDSGAPVYGMIDGRRVVVGVISAGGSRGADPVTFVASPVAALDHVVWTGKVRAVPESY